MNRFFLLCLALVVGVVFCSCKSKMVIIDNSTPMSFELADEYPGNDYIIKESSFLIKNILPGSWEMNSEQRRYLLLTVENPGERIITSDAENKMVKTRMHFQKNGKCSIENDILLDCASSFGKNSVWEGSWNVVDGVLVLDMQLIELVGSQAGSLTLKADINVVSHDSINLYWRKESIEKAAEIADKIIKKRYSAKKLSANVSKLELYYGIDDFVYRTFSHEQIVNDKYYRKNSVEEISKISHPVFSRIIK